jgi:hypothetical protein
MDDALTRVIARLEALAHDLPPDELRALGLLLTTSEDEVSGYGVFGSAPGGSTSDMMGATQQMQDAQQSFNLQYLQLQTTYTSLSSVLQAKAATARNALNNIS